MKTGIEIIKEERERQVSQGGWMPEHDDTHDKAEMAQAAKHYVHEGFIRAKYPNIPRDRELDFPTGWPWHMDWWKPSEDPIRNLAKAGALIAAEIDHLQRIQSNTGLTCRTE